MSFHIDPHSWTVWVQWPDTLDKAYAAGYLTGPVLGFLLRLRGRLCLHASAVVLGEMAVVFVGPSGAGKSTLAAAFAHRRKPVLTDDVAVLEERGGEIWIQPGYPRLRLYDDAVQLVGREPADFPMLARRWNKRFLKLGAERLAFRRKPARVAALLVLGDPVGREEAISVKELRGVEAMKPILVNTFSNYLLDRRMRAQEFEAVGNLVRSVPVSELLFHRGRTRPAEVCEWIERHVG